jgi:gliding motility-associated-like protein
MRQLLTAAIFMLISLCSQAQFQGVIINEIAKDYVELLVVGKPTCTPGTANLMGWIIDDNNGWFGTDASGSHASKGHLRLSLASIHWSRVPIGSVILIYDPNSHNPNIPPDDYIDVNNDKLYVLPATVHLDMDNASPKQNSTSFTSYKGNYVWGAHTNWDAISLDDDADAMMLVDPNAPDRPYFAFAYGDLSNGAKAETATAGGVYKPTLSLAKNISYLINADYSSSGNYAIGTQETPGKGNTPENEAWIKAMQTAAKPVLNITDPVVCAPSKVDLTRPFVTEGSDVGLKFTYWTNTTATTAIPDASAVSSGGYYIKATNAFGCWIVNPVNATVLTQPPTPQLSVVDNCDGTSVLTANGLVGGGEILWSNGGTTSEFTVTASGSFTAVQKLTGCTSKVSNTVTAAPKTYPQASVTATPLACGQLGSINVSATKGTSPYSFSLNTGTFVSSNKFNNLTAGTYTITVKDAYGCSTTSAIDVVNKTMSSSIEAAEIPCGQAGTITVTVSKGTAPFNYSMNGGTYTSNNIFTGLTAGNYTITIKDGTGCEVQMNAKLVKAGFTSTIDAPDFDCGQKGIITLSAAAGQAPYTFSLNNGDFTPDNVFSGLNAGSYTITVKDNRGCVNELSATIKEKPSPISVSTVPVAIPCTNTSIISVAAANGTGPYSYSFNGSNYSPNNSYKGLSDGSYTISVKDATGCTTDPVTVAVKSSPPFHFELEAEKDSVRQLSMVTVNTSSSSQYNIVSWSPAPIFRNQNSYSQTFRADSSLMISVVAQSEDGCLDTATVMIKVAPLTDVFVPSAFTPNGDGKNDIFRVMSPPVLNADFRIFNRWGQQIFFTNDIFQGWDGTLSGKKLPTDVFIYTVQVRKLDGSIVHKKGTVTLIR